MISLRSEREIGLLREANQIVARAHEAVAAVLKPGVTTAELDAVAEQVILDAGARPAFKGYNGFPASTCISVEEVVVHGIPGARKINAGEVVSVDIGVCHKGYYGDAAVTHACGAIDAERQHLLDMTDLALSRAIRAAKAGNFIRDIALAVEETCRPEGLGIVEDFVGHGIGDEMHLEPQVPNFDTGRKGPKLRAGMVLAIEPMITMGTHRVKVLRDGWTAVTADGTPAAHFEHSIVVREDGGEILSGSDSLVWGRRTEIEAMH
ncbi:MAG: type I methionyl aminopeptidase [Candidatus Hydrogenedens sp.]|nr:type I methionyl aminopeptidase [Candidatus Hydrogenedens sp.]